jgi:hypothetical protein
MAEPLTRRHGKEISPQRHRDTEKRIRFFLLPFRFQPQQEVSTAVRPYTSIVPLLCCSIALVFSPKWEAPQCAESGEPLIERPLHWAYLIEVHPALRPYRYMNESTNT